MTNPSTKEGVTSQKMCHSSHDDPVRSVFTTPDLLLDIICPLIGADFLPTLHSLSTVSKNFHQAVLSKKLWQEMCYQRWKGKWGFHPRWEKALVDHQQQTYEESTTADDNFWKSRYFYEEKDSTRKLIFARELESLVFDFRFWIGQPAVVDGQIIVKSGLLSSASEDVRFDRSSVDEFEDDDDISSPKWSARGQVTGHPCREPGIEWFLDEQRGTLQWGFMPNLWPQGSLSRLDNWGWQIQNPNVVLRSIDPLPSSPKHSQRSKLDDIEREHNNNEQNVTSDHLWKDLIGSLENVPLRAAPLVNGFTVTADIPRAFIEQYEY